MIAGASMALSGSLPLGIEIGRGWNLPQLSFI